FSAQRRRDFWMLAVHDACEQFKQEVRGFLAIEHRLNASRRIADLKPRLTGPERNHETTSRQRVAQLFNWSNSAPLRRKMGAFRPPQKARPHNLGRENAPCLR